MQAVFLSGSRGISVARCRRSVAKPSSDRRPKVAGPRPRRFPIRAAVHYRADDGPWRQGMTENISRNGLLLHATEAINPDMPIDVVVDLPPAVAGGPAATIVCRGRVARIVDPIDVGEIVVALALTHCRVGRIEVEAPKPYDA
jgi:hypothetical protein